MAVKLGHFVYEYAGDGCLFSKYCNHGLNMPLTESATRIEKDSEFPDDRFCGKFLATWVESISELETQTARLTIKRQPGSDNEAVGIKYMLIWEELKSGNRLFHGEAILYKDMLVVAYQ